MKNLWKLIIWVTIITSVFTSTLSYATWDLSELLWTSTSTQTWGWGANTVTNQTINDLNALLWNTTNNTSDNTNVSTNTTSFNELSKLLWEFWEDTSTVNETKIVSAIDDNWTKRVVIDWFNSDLLIELEWNTVFDKKKFRIFNVSWSKIPVFNYTISTNVKDIKVWENISWKVYLSIQENVSKLDLSITWLNINRIVRYINRDTNQVQEVAKINFVKKETKNTNTLANLSDNNIVVSNNVNNNVWNTWIEDHPFLILMLMFILWVWYIQAKRKSYL